MPLYICDLVLYLSGQTYQHASAIIQSLVEEDINVKFLVQLDKLIRLLETPIFAYLRLQVFLIKTPCLLYHYFLGLIIAYILSLVW